MVPHTLALVDHSPLCCPKTSRPLACNRNARGWILEGNINENGEKFSFVCKGKWAAHCMHMMKIEEEYLKMEPLFVETCEQCIDNLEKTGNSSSDTESTSSVVMSRIDSLNS
jgi:hypothetical protein